MTSQGPEPDFKIVSVSIYPWSLGVCYRAQRCGQTQEWLTDRGTSTCAKRKSPPPLNSLAWLGLEKKIVHSERSVSTKHQERAHQDEHAPHCPATKPCGPGTPRVIRASCSSTQPTSAPVAASSIPPRTSDQSTAQPAVHHRSQPTGGLVTTRQPSSSK